MPNVYEGDRRPEPVNPDAWEGLVELLKEKFQVSEDDLQEILDKVQAVAERETCSYLIPYLCASV